ncbi:MAG: HNH endonuclease [Mycoplasmataceae bacterium]|nr:HNH endonuclease [Mycoplasmataceae bacterium]
MNHKIFNIKDKWLEIVYQALINLNGTAKYNSIYQEVLKIAPDKCANNQHWKSRVRATIQWSSSDSKYFKPINKDLFISLDGIGKGSWGIRGFIEQRSYVEVLEMINEFKSILVDDWKVGNQINLLNLLLDKKARSGFRNKVIKSRELNNVLYYSDLEKIDLSGHNLDMKLTFVEAAHIFDVWCIKEIVLNHKRKDIKDDTTVVNLLNALDDSSNALLLPFNYHKLFDLKLIWFDDKTGHMKFNIDFEDDLAKLGIYPTRIKSNIMNNKDVIKYLSIRNRYRQNQLNDIWTLFQKDIVHLLNV